MTLKRVTLDLIFEEFSDPHDPEWLRYKLLAVERTASEIDPYEADYISNWLPEWSLYHEAIAAFTEAISTGYEEIG